MIDVTGFSCHSNLDGIECLLKNFQGLDSPGSEKVMFIFVDSCIHSCSLWLISVKRYVFYFLFLVFFSVFFLDFGSRGRAMYIYICKIVKVYEWLLLYVFLELD